MRTPKQSRMSLRQIRNQTTPPTTPTTRPRVTQDQDIPYSDSCLPTDSVPAQEIPPTEAFLGSNFQQERLEPPLSIALPPPPSDSVSVLSLTPVNAVTAVGDALIRQVSVPVIPLLPTTSSKSLIAQWIALVSDSDMNHSHLLYLSLDTKMIVAVKFAAYFTQHPLETPRACTELSKTEFCRILKNVFSDVEVGVAVNLSLHRRIKDMNIVRFNLADSSVENTTVVNLSNVCREFVDPFGNTTIDSREHLLSVKVLNDLLPRTTVDWRSIVSVAHVTTIDDRMNTMNATRNALSKAKMYGFTVQFSDLNINHYLISTFYPLLFIFGSQSIVDYFSYF